MPRVEVPAFTGGLVTRISEEDLKPNQLSEASNITISKTIGAVETRRGLELWDSLSFLSDMNMFWQNVFATSGLVIRNGNDLYIGDTIVYESMEDAETIFEIFDNWLVMCNGTRNLKYKDTGMALRWNTGYCYKWEDDYKVAAMYSALMITRISDDTTYKCCHTWEVQMLDGEIIEGTALIFYTSSSDVETGEVYSDENDIIYLDCEETTGTDFVSASLKGLVFSPTQKPISSNTKLFLTMDGTDESTTFTDTGDTVHTVTAHGNAQVDTTYRKIGSGSLILDGVNSYLSIPDHTDWNFGSNPFTVDYWYRHPGGVSGTEYQYLFMQYADIQNYLMISLVLVDSYVYGLQFINRNSGVLHTAHSVFPTVESRPAPQIWHHFAQIRGWGGDNDTWAGTHNGSLIEATPDTLVTTVGNYSAEIRIGRYLTEYTGCHLDNLRVTKGEALWTAPFIPPYGTVEHSTSEKKYGSQALKITELGGNIASPGGSSFEILDSDFTLMAFILMDSVTVDSIIFEQKNSTDGFRLWYDADGGDATTGAFVYSMFVGGTEYTIQFNSDPGIVNFVHVAVIRGWGGVNSNIVVCVDGVPGTVGTAQDMAPEVQDEYFFIGGNDYKGFKGYIDEIRYTAEAFYTSAFTVPASAYSPATTTVSHRDINLPVQLGITPPADVVTVADSGDAGNPDGTYSYKTTYLNDRGSESNPSDASGDVVVATNKVSVSDIPISIDPQVTQRRLYRTTDGGASYLLVTTIDNNSDETYTDNIADTSLGAAAPSDNDVPPAFSCIAEHQGLLYGVEEAEENVLWYCNQFDELDHWNDTNYETLGSGDVVTHGLISFGNLLVALQRAYLWIFNTGDDTLERAFTNHGVHNAHSFLNTGDGILYIDVNGMFSYTTIAYDTMRSVSLHQLIGDIFDSESNNANRLDPDYVSNVRVGGIGDDVFISYTRYGQTTNDRTIHYNKEAKRVETLMDEGFVAFTHDVVNKNLYGCSTNGYIYKLLTGSDDNGTAISWSFSTKDFAKEFGSIVALKQAGWMFLDCNPSGETLTIQVYYDDTLVKTFTSDEASRYILRKKLPVPTQWNRVRFALSGSGKQYVYGLAFDGELTQRRRDSEIQR